MHGYTTGASNLPTFREVACAFRITPGIVGPGMAFALVMGVLGGLLPSVRAARLPIAAPFGKGPPLYAGRIYTIEPMIKQDVIPRTHF